MNNSDLDTENNNSSLGQNSSQQRKLCYRELLNQIEEIQESEDLGFDTVKQIGGIIKKVNAIETEINISQRMHHPEEYLLDSAVLSSASTILVKCVQNLDVSSSTYDTSEFANKIIAFVKGDDEFSSEHLTNLLSDAQQIIPELPPYCYTYGSYDLQNLPKPHQKKERQKKEKQQFERKEPEKVTTLEKQEQGIEEIVNELNEVLIECYVRNNSQPIKYYSYVVDTSSFAATVENMFYCSFLIRDGRARIDLDGTGVPFIEPMNKTKLKEYRDNNGANAQIITGFSIPEWEVFKKEGYIQRYRKKQTKHSV